MSTSITTINGKRCTPVPKLNRVGSGQATRTTTSATTTSSIVSTSTSIISTSTSEEPDTTATSTSLVVNLPIGAPAQDASTSPQVASTSTTSSTSSQNVLSSTTSIPSAIEPSAALPFTSTLSSVTESLPTFSSAVPFNPITTTSVQTTSGDSSSTSQTNGGPAPTTLSDVLLSTSSSKVVAGDDGGATATTTQGGTGVAAGAGQIESASGATGLRNGAQNIAGSGMSTQKTVAVAGGVVGGLAVISIIAFLLWFYRKRLVKKRRSTLLTPLSTGNAYRRSEKGPYIISRNSLGPTSVPEKMRAMVGYNYRRLRGRVNSLVTRSPKPSVDLNRGNSQFGLPDEPMSRPSSRAGMTDEGAVTTNNRFVDWWGRLTEDSNLNWKIRNEPRSDRPDDGSYTSMANAAQSRQNTMRPDFLTLPGVDEEQQRQAAASVAGGSNPRRSQSLGNEHFLGSLGLKFGVENPFADSNVMSHDSAKVMPLAVSGPMSPFSDANAIPGPARAAMTGHGRRTSSNGPNRGPLGAPVTYVQSVRRSRGHSVSAANLNNYNNNMRPPSGGTRQRMPSVYRESSVSTETSDTRRNKFRSDPFDLDRPELLVRSSGNNGSAGSRYGPRQGRGQDQDQGQGVPNIPNIPLPTRARAESFTSKYSSGVSTEDWSDPGPDVGPAAAGRWDTTPSPDGALGRRRMDASGPGLGRNGSSASNGVGKAM